MSISCTLNKTQRAFNNYDYGYFLEAYVGLWLVSQGHQLLEHRHSICHFEVDLISEKDRVVYFTEVKSDGARRMAPTRLGQAQANALLRSAELWRAKRKIGVRVVLILVTPGKVPRLLPLEWLTPFWSKSHNRV